MVYDKNEVEKAQYLEKLKTVDSSRHPYVPRIPETAEDVEGSNKKVEDSPFDQRPFEQDSEFPPNTNEIPPFNQNQYYEETD